MERKSIMTLHMYLAAFIMPVAFMFLVTGALYTWGIKGSYESESFLVELKEPITQTNEAVLAYITQTLQEKGYSEPSGTPGFRKNDNGISVNWSGSNRDLSFSPTQDPLIVKFDINHTTWYRRLVQLHKAKGGTAFKVYAAILSVSLFMLLFSGYMMALQMPKFKKQTLIITAVGIVFFFVMMFLS